MARMSIVCLAPPLHVDALLGMSLQVPAGHVALSRKQGVGAGLRFRRIEDELRLATLLRNGVVGCDHDLSEGLAVGCHPMAKHSVVRGVCEHGQAQRR